MTTYTWHEIGDAPAGPGVYAWYYTPEITSFDLNRVTLMITTLKESSGDDAAKEAVQEFLDENVFRYFRELPYDAQLRGPLKPQYRGLLEHVPALSESLVARIVEEPLRLATIRMILEESTPHFASPVYIGMSQDLRKRLRRHKALIEKFGELPEVETTDEVRRDQSFAREVRRRKMAPPRLFVITKMIKSDSKSYVDIENILNRIHYPLLGRN